MTQDPLHRFDFRNARCLVTGAASGMGEQMARQLAAKGSRLLLVDRDGDRLDAVASELTGKLVRQVAGPHGDDRVRTFTADLADPDQVTALLADVRTEVDTLDLLVNNAGVTLGGRFRDATDDEFDWVQAINFRAPVALTRGLLPLMPPGSHIVNVSSLFGLVAPAGQTAYSASKFALRGFSEALRRELAADGIGVTTVHPGGVRTRIAESARMAAAVSPEEAEAGKAAFARMLSFPADRAAAQILDGVHRRRPRVVVTPEARMVDAAARIAPVRHLEIVQHLQRRARRVSRRLRRPATAKP